MSNNVEQRRRKKGKRLSKRQRRRQKRILRGLTILAMVCIVVFVGGIVYTAMNPSLEKKIQGGFESMEKEKYEDAQKKFQFVIEKEAKIKKDSKKVKTVAGSSMTSEAYRGLGLIAFEQEAYEEACTQLEKALETGVEETPILYNLLGISYMKLEQYEEALDAFEKGIALPDKETLKNQKKKEQVVDYGRTMQEMKYNRIICLEKTLNWSQARVEMEAYTTEYPEDISVKKEAEFLATR